MIPETHRLYNFVVEYIRPSNVIDFDVSTLIYSAAVCSWLDTSEELPNLVGLILSLKYLHHLWPRSSVVAILQICDHLSPCIPIITQLPMVSKVGRCWIYYIQLCHCISLRIYHLSISWVHICIYIYIYILKQNYVSYYPMMQLGKSSRCSDRLSISKGL